MRPVVLGVPVYRRYDLLAGLIESAMKGSVPPARFVVVDNGAKFDELYKGPQERMEIIRPGTNLGVSTAWNLILDEAFDGEDVCIANDDIEVAEDGIDVMQAALEHHKGRAVVLGHHFSLFLMRKALVAELGWFDEKIFPAYFEDNDYAYRAKVAGVPMPSVNASKLHHGSATLHSLEMNERLLLEPFFKSNALYYIKKWGGPPGSEAYTKPTVEPTRKSR